jgi:mannose-1-phosphate guanylyltransferase
VGHRSEHRWGLILAGGEGRRLRSLTSRICGEDRPKQFCAVLGAETLLERTRRRAALAVAPARTVVVLTRPQERFYRSLVAGLPPQCPVIQPRDLGTAAAVLYGLLRIGVHAPMAPVAILPSDHYVSDDAGFMRHVATAFAAVTARPELVVLLGIAPSNADPDYGWIEPADRIPRTALLRVAGFWEKPGQAAGTLLQRGCLWNTFVMVGRIPAFLALIRRATPDLAAEFDAVRPRLGGFTEAAAIRTLYARLSPLSFSEGVLQTRAANLAVLPVRGLEWSDWGTPARVLATLAGLGVTPDWAPRVSVAAAAPPGSGTAA